MGHSGVAIRGIDPRQFEFIRNRLYEQTGIVLTGRKRALVESRITQRLRVLGLEDFASYLDYLRRDSGGEELVHLIDVISTNVTHFFREADHFRLIRGLTEQWLDQGANRLRFWSAACSTGEEPYSLAMALQPFLARAGTDIRILATDISTRVLAHARAGVFDAERLETVPESLRRRHFIREPGSAGDRYAVTEDLKRLVMFHRLNFTRMPYPIRGSFDLIMCRNAMIYFDRTLREKMVEEFARLLKPGGFLMVGHAETLIGMEKSFRTVRPSVYQRISTGENG
ncbi:MAG: protein-glutamate O-methyltransferase CheR [Candidatus Krumholzibacteriia bacterium]